MTGSFMIKPGDALAQQHVTDSLQWEVAEKIPPANGHQQQLGLAGVFTGVSHNVLLIAGGSNFADGAMPWQGGKKLHYDNMYALLVNDRGERRWLFPRQHIQYKTAYGASTTTAEGVVCAGGETSDATGSRQAFIMNWDAAAQDVKFTMLPLLPIPLANASMSSIGHIVYLIGGESNGVPSAQCYLLNLAVKGAKWLEFSRLPVAISHSAAVTQSNGKYSCIYVMGGRSATLSGISDLHGFTFCYDPFLKKWTRLSNIGDGNQLTNLSAASAVAEGDHDILLIGGDKGDVFHRIESFNALIAKAASPAQKQQYQQEKLKLLHNHQGFSRDVYQYNTLNGHWKKISVLPFFGQVTTTAVKWNQDIIIPGGEIKPGVRTPAVNIGKWITK